MCSRTCRFALVSDGVYSLQCVYVDAQITRPLTKGQTTDPDAALVGVTSVDDELFVLLRQKQAGGFWANLFNVRTYRNIVVVYSIIVYQTLRHFKLSAVGSAHLGDITSCVRHKCLYTSDTDNSCVHRYDLASSTENKWPVSGRPYGLSVTPSCNLLVACQGEAKLVELSADSGQCVREIALESDIVNPWHGVQLTNGQFVVSHGRFDSLHRVCVVGDDGKVTCSYGGLCKCEVGQLNVPCHVAVDKDSQFIFAADHSNQRVVLLSPTLQFVRYIRLIEGPRRLYLHQATRRLFVGHFGDDVTVIHL